MPPLFFSHPGRNIQPSPSIVTRLCKIEVRIEFKSIKHIYLRLSREGKVRISAPLKYCGKTRTTLTDQGRKILSEFIDSKKSWISRRQEAMKSTLSQLDPIYRDNTPIQFWDQKILLVVIPSSRGRCELDKEGRLVVHTPNPSPQVVGKIVEKWQRKQLDQAIRVFSQKWENIMGLQAQEYRIRKMKTRWGTCNPSAKRIWISLALVGKPKICLEYILVHELVHFLERKHNQRFWSFMSQFLPEWKEYRKLLNQVNP